MQRTIKFVFLMGCVLFSCISTTFWVRSYFVTDELGWAARRPAPPANAIQTKGLLSYAGRVGWSSEWFVPMGPHDVGFRYFHWPTRAAGDLKSRPGFAAGIIRSNLHWKAGMPTNAYRGDYIFDLVSVWISYWLLTLLLAAFPAWHLIRHALHQRARRQSEPSTC